LSSPPARLNHKLSLPPAPVAPARSQPTGRRRPAVAASTTVFCVSLYELGDSYIRNFTPAQLACSYPGRTWFDRGIVAVGSSDVPVVDCNVLRNLRSAVTRLTQSGQCMGPEQAVTIDEALRMFTRHGAFASFEEKLKGTITPGKLADLVVLSGDPRSVDPVDLDTLSAEMTILDGRVIHQG
jgi:predicted amidohydrolase YtcJ